MTTYIKTLCLSTIKNVRGKAPLKVLTSQPTTAKYYSNIPWCLHKKLKPDAFTHQLQRHLQVIPKLAAKVSFSLSDIGEGITEVIIKEWYVKIGDVVQQFDNICEVQSDKASVTITSRYDGKISKLYYNVDDTAMVGKPLVDIDTQEPTETDGKVETRSDTAQNLTEAVALMSEEQTESSSDEDTEPATNKVLTTPAVRRLAREYQIPIEVVPGTGKHGRVLKDDVLAYYNALNYNDSIENKSITEEKITRITGIQKAMFKTMTKANTIPHFTYADEVSVTKLVELRSQMKSINGVRVTFLPFFIKAVSKCLSEFPLLNSSIDDSLEQIIYKSQHNIGIAVDSPQGLQVPNIKNVERLNIAEIAQDLNRLQKLGIDGRLRQEDLSGGTFTISNIGSIGGMFATPVILPPEVAILAIGRIQVLPRFSSSGNVVKDEIMCINWSADHRIIDGATVAKFSNLWKEFIQNPHHVLF